MSENKIEFNKSIEELDGMYRFKIKINTTGFSDSSDSWNTSDYIYSSYEEAAVAADKVMNEVCDYFHSRGVKPLKETKVQ